MTKKPAKPATDQLRRQWVACKREYPDVCMLIGGIGNLTYYAFDEDAERIRGEAHIRAVGEQIVAVDCEHAQSLIAALVATGQRVCLAEQVTP